MGSSTRGLIHRSSAAKKGNGAPQGCFSVEADGYLNSLHDHGNLLFAPRQGQHLRQLGRIVMDIDIGRPVPVGLPSLVAEGSGVCSVDDDFFSHGHILVGTIPAIF
ncbi:MAG TPA: hypothetical protein DCG53_05470 [Syntrophus sp. (in: bacteria)]|nr:hypothetical protein [Syntrophus sp. (in: bacteria)]